MDIRANAGFLSSLKTYGALLLYTTGPLADIWAANCRFGYDYNQLYDLYYKAGLRPDKCG